MVAAIFTNSLYFFSSKNDVLFLDDDSYMNVNVDNQGEGHYE